MLTPARKCLVNIRPLKQISRHSSPSFLLISFSFFLFFRIQTLDKTVSICFPVLFTTTTIHKAHCLSFLASSLRLRCLGVAFLCRDNKIIRLLLTRKSQKSLYGKKKLKFCVLFIFIVKHKYNILSTVLYICKVFYIKRDTRKLVEQERS